MLNETVTTRFVQTVATPHGLYHAAVDLYATLLWQAEHGSLFLNQLEILLAASGHPAERIISAVLARLPKTLSYDQYMSAVCLGATTLWRTRSGHRLINLLHLGTWRPVTITADADGPAGASQRHDDRYPHGRPTR